MNSQEQRELEVLLRFAESHASEDVKNLASDLLYDRLIEIYDVDCGCEDEEEEEDSLLDVQGFGISSTGKTLVGSLREILSELKED